MSIYTLNKEKYQIMLNFKREIATRIKDPDFYLIIEEIFNKVDFEKVNLTKNGFTYINTKKEPSILEISITKNEVFYSIKNLYESSIKKGLYHLDKNGKSYIKYTNIDEFINKNIYKGKINLLYNLYDIKIETFFQCFDENKKEIWYLEEIKQDNYYQNKITNEKIPTELNYFENYLEKNYYFRDHNDYIIKRFIKKYNSKQTTEEIKDEDFYLISKNYFPNNKKLPRGGCYYGVPKEMIANYKLGKCDFEQMYKSRVRERTTTTYF